MGILTQEGWVCPCNIHFNNHVTDVVRYVWGTLSVLQSMILKGDQRRGVPDSQVSPIIPVKAFLFRITFPNLYSVPPTNCHSVPLGCVVLIADLLCPHQCTSAYSFHPFSSHSLSTHFQSQLYRTICSSISIPSDSNLSTFSAVDFLH